MLRRLFVIFMFSFACQSLAAQYNCSGSLSNIPSVLWNGSYWIRVAPTFGESAVARVRLSRNLSSSLRFEMIQMNCQPGTFGAEYDCIESQIGGSRPEMLAAQFYPNGWAGLYSTPRTVWQPFLFGRLYCARSGF